MSRPSPFAAAAARFRGERIGKYEIVAQLSMGGMAELFLAFTSGPGGFRKYVVVKRILPDLRHDEQFVKMFLDEARISAAFNHPNIAHVFDLGESEQGLYLAMEFIAGQNLNQLYAACRARMTPIPVGLVCTVARDVALALHYAHTFVDPGGRPSPVIHRDVAQKNVMVAFDGSVKLLDFGIAKARGSLGRTRVGIVKGTTGYMSPEQVTNGELDGRSDVFSVGVMLHELLCGQRLFSAPTEQEEMRKILSAPIPEPISLEPDLPEAISSVVMKALARKKEERFGSAKELARALEKAAGPYLFDRERIATFMREHFDARMKATQALLESAEGAADDQTLQRALDALRADDGMVFAADTTDETAAPEPPPSSPGVAPAPPPSPTDSPRAKKQTPKGAVPAAAAKAPPASHARRQAWIWGIAALLFAGVLGFWGLQLSGWGSEPASLPRGYDPTGGMKPISEPLNPNAGAIAPVVATTSPAPVPSEPAPPSPEMTSHRDHARRFGKLTLVTRPGCEVFLAGKRLGKTPLFGATLPAGVHLLKLKGRDGKVRTLSVPIVEGRTAALKLSLADLPVQSF